MTQVAAEPSRIGSQRGAAATLTATMTAVFAGVTVTTALLPGYRTQWGLSISTTTLLFVIYVAGVAAALVLLGRLADVIGNRRVILAAVVLADVGTVVAASAPAVGWVLAARVVQGLAVGLVAGAVAAALRPVAPGPLAARLVSLATTAGIALGLLFGAAFAGLGPRWTWIAYLVLLVPVSVWAIAGVVNGSDVPIGARWRVQRPVLPGRGRPEFVVSLGAIAVVSAGMGLFAGLGPVLAARDVSGDNVVIGAVVAVSAYLVSGAVQLVLGRRLQPLRVAMLVLIAGVAVLVVAARSGNLVLLLIAALVLGIANGLAFPVTIAAVARLAPADNPAGATSTYYLALYAGIAVPLIGFGLLTDATSLPTAALIFAVVVGAAAFALALASRDPPRELESR